MHEYLIQHAKTPTLSKKMNMHAYLIEYVCIYILTSVNTIIKQKK